MKATINIEFTDDELVKHAGDVGRRWAMSFFQEAYKTGQRLKIKPDVLSALGEVLMSAVASSGTKKQTGPVPHAGPVRCVRNDVSGPGLPVNPNLDDGWFCCRCDSYNGMQRSTCRLCRHERCDVIAPPPPAQQDPSVS